MQEGWIGKSYVILFDDAESERMTKGYGVSLYLPGCRVVAIVGWDDLVVENEQGERFRVPTVPMDESHMAALDEDYDPAALVPDPGAAGKIKWYLQPVILGGNPHPGDNVTWVSPEDHQKLVRWWNRKYRETLEKEEP